MTRKRGRPKRRPPSHAETAQYEAIRRNVRARLALLGLSLVDIASLSGISRQSLSGRLNGDRISDGTVELFACALCCPVDALRSLDRRAAALYPLPSEGWRERVSDAFEAGRPYPDPLELVGGTA